MINLNTVDLQLFEEKKTIDRILTDLKIGWWKVDHEKKGYVLSDIAVKMLKLDSNIILLQNLYRDDTGRLPCPYHERN